jgi:hypothetical protein
MGDFTTAYTFVRQGISPLTIVGYVLALASAAASAGAIVRARRVGRTMSVEDLRAVIEGLSSMVLVSCVPVFLICFIFSVNSWVLGACALLSLLSTLHVFWRLRREQMLAVPIEPKKQPVWSVLVIAGAFAGFGLMFAEIRYVSSERPYAELLQMYQRQEYQIVEGCIQEVRQHRSPRETRIPYDIVTVADAELEIKREDSLYPGFDLTDYRYFTMSEGLYVRIFYVPYNKPRDVILRIDTRPASCPLVGPSP